MDTYVMGSSPSDYNMMHLNREMIEDEAREPDEQCICAVCGEDTEPNEHFILLDGEQGYLCPVCVAKWVPVDKMLSRIMGR